MKRLYSILNYVAILAIVFALFNVIQHTTASLGEGDYQVWSAPTTVKVTKDDISYSPKGPAQINVSAVKNEYENAQLFITAYENIESYYLNKTNLSDGKGNVISASNITVYNQKYINCYNENPSYGYQSGYYPDALIPIEYAQQAGELSVQEDNNAGLWITFYIPADTPAGVYTATFTLSLENLSIPIPVSVTVYDYVLSDEIHFWTSFTNRIMQIAAGELDTTYEMAKAYYDFALDYRLSLKFLPKRADTVDEFVEAAIEYYDLTACYDIEETRVIRKLAQYSTPERNLMGKAYLSDGFDEPYMYYLDNPSNPLLQNTVNILKDIHNDLEAIYNEIKDDNTGKYDSFKQIENWEKYILDLPIVIPDHFNRIYLDLDDPLVWEYLKNLNVICPLWNAYDDNNRIPYLAMVEMLELDTWWYSTLAPQKPYGNYQIADTSLLSPRTISWLQKKYNIEGNLFWDFAAYVKEDYDNFGEAQYKPVDVFEKPYRLINETFMPAGDGNFTYPGKAYGHYGPLPSMRLMSIRDGLEEYEMLLDLENKYTKMAESGKYGEINVAALMNNFYNPIHYQGAKLRRDGQAGFNFTELRNELLFTLENISDPYSSMEKTYNPVMKSKLTLDFNSGTVTAQVKGGQSGCQYQYWVKKKVETYSVQGSSSYQYIWQILSDYSTSVSASIPATEIYRDENGNYNVMVRIRKDGTVIDELYGAFTYTQVGQPFITQVSIDSSAVYDEPAVIRKGSDVRITTLSNMPALPCEVFIDWSNVPLCTGTDSVARFDMVPEGLHDLKVRIGSGANSAEKIIKIYVVDNYQAEKIPVITSLDGTTVSGATTFTMRVGYADGSPITEEDISDFRYELTSGQLSGELSEAQIADGQIEVQFTMNYGQNGYGIYKTTATVRRKAKSAYDDIFITDYSGYTRSATFTLTGNSQVATGSSIQYTASGNITGLIGTIQYAFYREDASGWVLLRDYGSQGQFTWTPLRPGVYNIQARIKDSAAGSYERAATKTLTVTGSSLSGNLNVKVVSLDSGMTVEKLYAGRPYKLYAEYGGSETPLYQFTLTGENIGTVYLNAFNTDPYYIFVPQRPGEYTIFARAIHQGSFGCGDKSASVDVEVFPKTSEIAKGVDLLDFEHESQLGPITTPNDNNRVIIQRVNYGDTDVVPLQGMGDYALKLTPTVNPWPQFHIVLDRKIRALVVFDYYIESAISGEYAWNCKNPYTGQGLGELDHFENEYQNTWYRASHAFDFEADEIWLWLYLTHSDVTQVNIYIDNFRIIDLDSAHMPDVMDFEDGSHLGFLDTHDGGNAVDIEWYAYSEADIPALSGAGDYALKLTPTLNPWPEVYFLLNHTYPAGARIEFDFYIESPYEGAFAWNYKNPNIEKGMGELDEFGSDNNSWLHAAHRLPFASDEIWIWLYMDGYSDVTRVNIYIDNFRIIYDEDSFDFEQDSQLYCIDTPSDGNRVIIDRVKYSEAGITPVRDSGEYVAMFTPTQNPWPEMHFLLTKTYPAGSRIEFDYYIEGEGGIFAWNFKDPSTGAGLGELDSFSNNSNNAWYRAYHTFSFGFDEIWIWLYMDGYSDVTEVNIYIDNLRIREPAELTFEDASQMSLISTTDDDNRVIINRLTYSQAGISAPQGGGQYVARFTPTVNPFPEIHFLLSERYPAGTRIEFDYNIRGTGGIYAWNYKDAVTGAGMGEIDQFENTYNNVWYHASHTFDFEIGEIWLWLYMFGYSDITQVHIYIDNFRIIEFTDEVDFEQQTDMVYIGTVNGNNRMNISRVAYSQSGISAAENGGKYASRFIPTVSSTPEIRISLPKAYPVRARIEFDYYVRSASVGTFTWNYKNPLTGADMGQLDSFTSANNAWHHASNTFEFEFDKIWLWLNLSGYPDVTQVQIFIDNLRIIEYEADLDFEEACQIRHVGTTDDGNRVKVERVSYDSESIAAAPNGGRFAVKFTPTLNPWPEMHFLLDETLPVGARIEFDYYINGSGGVYAWNYKDPSTGAGMGEIDEFENSSHDTWYHAAHTFDFASDEIWLWLYMDGYSDVTQVNIYIDNIRIIY